MSTHSEALERLATRGFPRGADVLIRGIGESLADDSPIMLRPVRPRRRPSGPIWAAVVAALVLAVGLVGSWMVGPSDPVSGSGVSWHRVEVSDHLAEVVSGPGGFVATDRFSGEVWFSPNGVSWTSSRLPESGSIFIGSVLSTRDRWLVVGHGGDDLMVWTSEDGQFWALVDSLPSPPDTVQQIVSTPDYLFLVSRDVFGEGTKLWRSVDGETWTEIPTGPITGTSGWLGGTAGGLVLYEDADVSVSTDGTTWSTATLGVPSELGEGRLRVEAVNQVGGVWVAIIAVERAGQDPVLAVLSSENAESWDYEGIPPFGQTDNVAPGLQSMKTIGDRLVVVPDETPTTIQEDGMVVASGTVRSTGQIWSSTGGADWVLELDAEEDIIAADGAAVDGRPIGVWVGAGGQTTEQDTPVVTTTPMPNEPLDPDGLAFQAAVIEDGTVTLEEFEQALEHWKTCMEERGVTSVEYTIDRSGGVGMSYASPSPGGHTEGLIDNLCQESWVNKVSATLASQ